MLCPKETLQGSVIFNISQSGGTNQTAEHRLLNKKPLAVISTCIPTAAAHLITM